jgi:hypothetical protein
MLKDVEGAFKLRERHRRLLTQAGSTGRAKTRLETVSGANQVHLVFLTINTLILQLLSDLDAGSIPAASTSN